MSWMPWLLIIAIVIIVIGLAFENRSSLSDANKERVIFKYLALIDSAENADELIGMLIEVFNDHQLFHSELHEPFLQKAKSFGAKLSYDHWRLICSVADKDSELEREALKQLSSKLR